MADPFPDFYQYFLSRGYVIHAGASGRGAGDFDDPDYFRSWLCLSGGYQPVPDLSSSGKAGGPGTRRAFCGGAGNGSENRKSACDG